MVACCVLLAVDAVSRLLFVVVCCLCVSCLRLRVNRCSLLLACCRLHESCRWSLTIVRNCALLVVFCLFGDCRMVFEVACCL